MAEADEKHSPGGSGESQPKPNPPGHFEGESMTRRKAFTVIGQALGGAAAMGVALPAVGFAVAPIFEQEEVIWTPVGDTDQFTDDTYKPVIVTLVEGVGEAGKSTAYVRRGSQERGEEPGSFVAISTRCAHLGCPVRYVRDANNFICPCHGGVYGFQGEVIGGPPVRPLDRFQTRVRAGRVEVGPRYSVTSQLEPVRYRDPGEFVGGIWEYLYPPRPSVPPAPK